MKKPIIGITANQFVTDGGVMAGTQRQIVSNAYVDSILRAGGVPLILPIITSPEAISAQLEAVDGLLLSGGGDIQPQLFGEEPVPELGKVIAERDTHELTVLKMALASNKAVFGVCRGCQLLNIALGGTIYQHLAAQQFSVQHDQNSPGDYAGHTVTIEVSSKLGTIVGRESMLTNSFHHQAVRGVADGLRVSARAKDGVIEAIEHKTAAFVIGVQWHPELMIDKHPVMLELFKAFVSTAGRK